MGDRLGADHGIMPRNYPPADIMVAGRAIGSSTLNTAATHRLVSPKHDVTQSLAEIAHLSSRPGRREVMVNQLNRRSHALGCLL